MVAALFSRHGRDDHFVSQAPDMIASVYWQTFALLLDEDVQDHGITVVYDFDYVGLSTAAAAYNGRGVAVSSMVFDELLLAALPIEIKRIVLMREPSWIKLMLKLAQFFLPRRVAGKCKPLGDDWKACHSLLGGTQYTPSSIGDGTGTAPTHDRYCRSLS